MANYSLVVDSTFKPFSYADIIAPLKDSTEAHLKMEDELFTYATQAEALRAAAEREKDSEWAKKYKEYINEVDDAATQLSKQGLKPGSRQSLLKARKDYFGSVDPALKAVAQLQKISEAQYAQNPALRMVYGDTPTIQQLIGDMSIKPVGYSGKDVYEQAATTSKSASGRAVRNYIARDPRAYGYLQQIAQKGWGNLSVEDFQSLPEFGKLMETVENQFNNFEGLNYEGKQKLKSEVIKGLIDGIVNDEQVKYMQDLTLKAATSGSSNDRGGSSRTSTPKETKKYNVHPKDLISQLDVEDRMRLVDQWRDYRKKYFNADGTIKAEKFAEDLYTPIYGPNDDFWNHLWDPLTLLNDYKVKHSDDAQHFYDSPLNSFISTVLGLENKSLSDINLGGTELMDTIDKYFNDTKDTFRQTYYTYNIPASKQEDVMNRILTSPNNPEGKNINVVDIKGGKIQKKSGVTSDKVIKKNTKVAAIDWYGDNAVAKLITENKDDKIVTMIELPESVSKTEVQNMKNAVKFYNKLGETYNSLKKENKDGKITFKLSAEEIKGYYNLMGKDLSDAPDEMEISIDKSILDLLSTQVRNYIEGNMGKMFDIKPE